MIVESMLTTTDNPYNPFENYPAWFAFDTARGYNTSTFLARLVVTSENLSYPDQRLAIEQAIDEIVAENITGLYKKVTKEFSEEQEIRL